MEATEDNMQISDLLLLYLGFASQIDFLVGFIAAGEQATGSSDPYGLRSCATLICSYLSEIIRGPYLDLDEQLEFVLNLYSEQESKLPKNAPNFKGGDKMAIEKKVKESIHARLEHNLKTKKNIPYDVTRAVMNATPQKHFVSFLLVVISAVTLSQFMLSPEAKKLILAWRRAQGLLKESDTTPLPSEESLSINGKEFASALRVAEERLENLESWRGEERMQILSDLSKPVSDFLDAEKVLVGTEQEQQARLALLDRFIQVVKRVADLDYIEGGDITARKDSARLNQG